MSETQPSAVASAPAGEYETLFDNAPCGYLVLGPDGYITKSNATFSKWTGLQPEALIGKRWRDRLTVPGRIFYETNVSPLLRLRGGFEEVAIDVLSGSGEKIPMLVNAAECRDHDGEVVCVLLTLFRARERRGYERDLQGREAVAVQRLDDEKSTSELREQFIAVLGHDLRNPLASIVGAARLLRRESLSEKGANILQLMESSVDRMAGLIDDVMDFARGRLGSGISLSRKTAPLEPILRQVVDELEADDPARTILCDFDLPDPISFDVSRIGQLLSNLLGNALTHGDPKQPVRLHAATKDDRLELWVANAGKQIPPSAMERLFQPFFRGEVRPNQQGLGLGLHIASEIARSHGGTLEVRSDDTETRFTFWMPLDRSAA